MTEQVEEKQQQRTFVNTQPAQRLEPESIDKYQVVRLLGKGGMGAVYEVEHKILQQKYALKVLATDRPNEEDLERFKAEAKAISALQHEGLLRMYEFGISEDGQPFFVTDLFEGRSISQMIRGEEVLTTATIADITIQAAEGLAHAHERGIVHRDIKPSNILVSTKEDGIKVKVIDFGLAKQAPNADGNGPPTLTQTGAIVGTPQYMSPEQCQGHKLDNRSDIYSLGCVLYEMLTGNEPFNGNEPMAIMFQHLHEAPKEVRTSDKIKKSLAAVAMKCLAKDRESRYQSMDDVIKDVKAAIGGATIRGGKFKKAKPSKQERLKFYIFVGLLVPTAIAGALIAATYELWAPPVVLYSHIPIMDYAEAEARHAMKEADRMRNTARKQDGTLDKNKLAMAENMLRQSAEGSKIWNLQAANQLAQILALEGKYDEVRAFATQMGGSKPIETAQNLHSLATALSHGGYNAQARPLAYESYTMFRQLAGENDPRTIKELWNLACCDYFSGNSKAALEEFKAVLPKLKDWNPSLETNCRDVIQELSKSQ
jgi:predicted Ser/Thr protein kinase